MRPADLRAESSITIDAPVRTVFDAFTWDLLSDQDPLAEPADPPSRFSPATEIRPGSSVRLLQRVRNDVLVLEQRNDDLTGIVTYRFIAQGESTAVTGTLEMRFERRPFWGTWVYRLMLGGSVKRDLASELRRMKHEIEAGGPGLA